MFSCVFHCTESIIELSRALWRHLQLCSRQAQVPIHYSSVPRSSSHACLFPRILLSSPSQCPLDSCIHAEELSTLLSPYPSFLPTPFHLFRTDCRAILSTPFYLLMLLTFFLCTPAEKENSHTDCFLYTSRSILSISAPNLE